MVGLRSDLTFDMSSEEPSTSTGVPKAKKRKPAKSDWTWEDEMLMYDVVHRDKVTPNS